MSLTTLLPRLLFCFAGFFIGLICLTAIVLDSQQELSSTHIIKNIKLKAPLRIYSADNILLSEYGNEKREPLQFTQFPTLLIDAILATEDDTFYKHNGVHFSGLIRALVSNIKSAKTQQGASTITMQVARNFFLSPEKTYTRKIKEILLAIKLEQTLDKQQILTLYLNKIFLGHRSYGFGAAAKLYYGEPLQNLNLAQIAMLAGLPKAPSSNNPLRAPQRAIKRRNHVLKRLFILKKITPEQYQTAILAPITAKKHQQKNRLYAPYIAEMVRAEVVKQYGESAYWRGLNIHTSIHSVLQRNAHKALLLGLETYDKRHGFRGPIGKIDIKAQDNSSLTLSAKLQKKLTDTLQNIPSIGKQIPAIVIRSTKKHANLFSLEENNITLSLPHVQWARGYRTNHIVGNSPQSVSKVLNVGDIIYIKKKRHPKNDTAFWQLSQIPRIEGAIISMQPHTGKILALVGGYNYFQNKFNRATQSIRQAGSNIKPFIYSGALESGYKPNSLISGAPIVIHNQQYGTTWRPEDHSKSFFGPTRIRTALANSMNLVSIRLLRAIGIRKTKRYLEHFGFDISRFAPNLSMALGSGGVTPLEMVSAYSALANSGYKVYPQLIQSIINQDGEILYQAKPIDFCDICYVNKMQNDTLAVVADSTVNDQQTLIIKAKEHEQGAQGTTVIQKNNPIFASISAPRIIGEHNNFLITSMLKDVIQKGTAKKAKKLQRQDIAGKTGTTNDYIDAWFSGFTPEIATTVWVGFDTPQSMGRGESGGRTALPIWIEYMQSISVLFPEKETALPIFIRPGFVNKDTGKKTTINDPNATEEYFTIKDLLPLYAKKTIKEQTLLNTIHPIGRRVTTSINPKNERKTQQKRIQLEQEDNEGLF